MQKLCFFTALSLVLLLTVKPIIAQNFRLGFQANPQLCWMSPSSQDQYSSNLKSGIEYGLVADLFLAGRQNYILNTGLLISNQVLSASFQPTNPLVIGQATFMVPVDLLFKLNYIEIPFNIKLRSDTFYRTSFFGQFGVSNQFNISANATSSDQQLRGKNVSDAFSLYNLALLMGAGAEYELGRTTSLILGIQYSKGLTPATSIAGLSDQSSDHVLRLMIGVMF